METALLLKFFFAFVFVLSLMFLFGWFLKKIGLAGKVVMPGAQRRLKIVEFLPVDHRRKLVLLRRDDVEHLVLLGTNSETLIEADIETPREKVIELVKDQKSG